MPLPARLLSLQKLPPFRFETRLVPTTCSGYRSHSAVALPSSTLRTSTTQSTRCRPSIVYPPGETGPKEAVMPRCSRLTRCGDYRGVSGYYPPHNCFSQVRLVASQLQERTSYVCESSELHQELGRGSLNRMGYTEATAGFLQSGSTVIQVSSRV